MPQITEPLEHGNIYHIYNRGINGCDIFRDNENYEYFLNLYDKYISPIAETFAWVLMKNHFHFLVRIKDIQHKNLYQPFSNLFNSYSKAFNKRYERTGSLFEHPFRRKHISNKEYLRQAVLYIHNNPVHHRFVSHTIEYPWSSYQTCISFKPTKLERDTVIEWFNNIENLKALHDNDFNIEEAEILML